MAHRADLNDLSALEQQTLVNLMLLYLNDAIVAGHGSITHSGEELFTGHRAYIAGMEAFLAANSGGQFVPLPLWNPANTIPDAFFVVKDRDDGTARVPLQNQDINRPLPAQFESPAVCGFASAAALGTAINGWHGGVHGAIGGAMVDFDNASAAPIFWCWHAFLGDVEYDWSRECITPPGGTLDPAPEPVDPPLEDPPTDGKPTPNTYEDLYKWYQGAYPKFQQEEYYKKG